MGKKRLSRLVAKPRELSKEETKLAGVVETARRSGKPGTEELADTLEADLPQGKIQAKNKADIKKVRQAKEMMYQLGEAAKRSGLYRPPMERAPKPERVYGEKRPELDIEFGTPTQLPADPEARRVELARQAREFAPMYERRMADAMARGMPIEQAQEVADSYEDAYIFRKRAPQPAPRRPDSLTLPKGFIEDPSNISPDMLSLLRDYFKGE